MHEMSIAISIVDIATEEAQKANAKSFSEIVLDIGSLSGIEIDALEFAMDSACKGSVLDSARFKINHIQAVARCNNCGKEFEVDNVFSICPDCQQYDLDVFKGKEMKVKSLVVKE